MNEMAQARDLGVITSEIKVIEQQTAKAVIYGCIEIGKRLLEAKEIVGHGGWGKYLESHVQYSQQWATNLMNLYREYGQSQESLFENFANSQSFGKLEVTKHILLLGIPAEDRAAFAQEQDAENKSVRELQAAIRERDEARKAVTEQAERAKELEEQLGGTLRELESSGAEVQRLQEEARRTEQKEAEAAKKVEELQTRLREYERAVQEAEDALKAAREHPQVTESMMESLRQEAVRTAAKQAAAAVKKELEAVCSDAEKARQEAEALRARLAEAEKQAQQGTAELERVKIYLKGTQEQFRNLLDALQAVKLQDPDAGARMQANIRDKLIAGMLKALGEV